MVDKGQWPRASILFIYCIYKNIHKDSATILSCGLHVNICGVN